MSALVNGIFVMVGVVMVFCIIVNTLLFLTGGSPLSKLLPMMTKLLPGAGRGMAGDNNGDGLDDLMNDLNTF